MADISLKEYLEKVEVLLKTGKSDEVILHARQILKHYPRNAAANRFLGQALLEGTDFREAEPVLRQVLAVYPDDVAAHTALSDLNERLGKPDEAIWHLERALEGAPNHPPLLDKLRSLYQRHRDVENPHFQLTTAGVARQYVRNGLYDQAIETLQTTLEQSPRRADLRLLLAQTMWTAGMQVEAAETALDVLDTLPYCLEANRILTLLWLGEGRPS
ncbi:MAG TPA: tetratricopeptide repeat protein, partial [Spirillospora sp.]|nr:tetratricopeptide repeat protein [Spirillospora sp.]